MKPNDGRPSNRQERRRAARETEPHDGRPPHYLSLLMEHLRRAGAEAGKFYHVDLLHDDACRRPDGGPCTCQPDVVSGPAVDRKYGGLP